MKSRDELLKSIGEALALLGTYLGPSWGSWQVSLQTATGMLEAIEARVRGDASPSAHHYQDVRLGLYALRNLDEIDNGRLSLVLCMLDNMLKDREV